MKKRVNIPVFIPHLGCPNRCVFRHQRAISGVSAFTEERAKQEIDTVLSILNGRETEREIAFFGGSFTGIDRGLMIRRRICQAYRLKRIVFRERDELTQDQVRIQYENTEHHDGKGGRAVCI